MFDDSLLLIVSSSGVVQSLFLAIYLFAARKIQVGERALLGLLLLAITIRLIKSIGWYFYDVNDALFLNIGFAAHGFIGPLLLLYLAKKTHLLTKRWQQALVLIPPFILLISSPLLTLESFWYVGGYRLLLYFTVGYLVACGYLVWVIYAQQKIYFPWYRNLFLGVFIFCMAYFTNYIVGLNPYITGPVIYAVAIYMISFILFTRHEIFTPLGDKQKYKNINLTEEQMTLHRSKVEAIMLQEKPYLQSDFSLSKLSEITAIPKHLLSRFFSEDLELSFTDFTNTYRIERAKELLIDHSYRNHKIAFIAYECGFNSLSSFNAAFKKTVNVSPSEYKRQVDDK